MRASMSPSASEGDLRAKRVRPRDPLAVRTEGFRKLIHAATVAVPLILWNVSRPVGLALLGTAVVAALTVEITRSRVRCVRFYFLSRVRRLLRPHEVTGLSGATYMA